MCQGSIFQRINLIRRYRNSQFTAQDQIKNCFAGFVKLFAVGDVTKDRRVGSHTVSLFLFKIPRSTPVTGPEALP
ncbi:hypothetical protein UA45_20635 [Morganella morganii]|uniref:Uncharacterized protein n=1 Tax=Morganella morganii TaxID=582 RepID=A0A0D8L4C1_MORMO|nr:hypothetical protein UA45_20635 [Morganella morganii]